MIERVKYRPITRMKIFIACYYVFGGKLYGAKYSPRDEQDVIEDINHFKFLKKYNL